MKDISKLTKEEAKKELAYLAAELAKSDNAYYQNDEPYLTDAEYDKLKHRNFDIEARFPDLVRADSPSKRVGAVVQSQFNKIEHRFPMLSLADVFSLAEVEEFVLSVKRFLNTADNIDFMAEPKIDGLSFSASYKSILPPPRVLSSIFLQKMKKILFKTEKAPKGCSFCWLEDW